MRSAVALAGACFVALFGCKKPVEVSNVSLEVLALDGGLSGFVCKQPDDSYLSDRAVSSKRVAFVVDFISLGGQPKCDSASLSAWCDSHPCTLAGRSCFETTVGAAATGNQALANAYAAIRGEKLTASIPNSSVLVRLVATTETCAALSSGAARPYECAKLVGCASSCPVNLEGLDETVGVNLDMGEGYLGQRLYETICGAGVASCAKTPFDQLAGTDCPQGLSDLDPSGGIDPPGGRDGGKR